MRAADVTVTVVPENMSDSALIADINATDPDYQSGGNDNSNNFENLSYALLNNFGKFEINSNGEISSDQRPEPRRRAVAICADGPCTDGGGLFDDVQVTVNVNAVPVAGADNIITNAGTSPFAVPEWALLLNDSDNDGSAARHHGDHRDSERAVTNLGRIPAS